VLLSLLFFLGCPLLSYRVAHWFFSFRTYFLLWLLESSSSALYTLRPEGL
jgi:hypothetical protein